VSTRTDAAITTAPDRRAVALPRGAGVADGAPIRVAIVGATGYVGAELVRLLSRHPNVTIVGLVGRGRHQEPIGGTHIHLDRTGLHIDAVVPDSDAIFLALPHGAAAEIVPDLAATGAAIIDLGPDFRLRAAADYPRWYGFDHPRPDLLSGAVYGLPELHGDELRALRTERLAIVGAPGCYPTATLLALAPLARAGLIGDLVVDAKSGVSGAGREPKQDLMFGEVNESVKAYGIAGHRHVAEMEQELQALGTVSGDANANPGAHGVDFLPHLIPMTRGILSACHVRPTRPVTQAELDDLYNDAYVESTFVHVVAQPPATKHVLGSNTCRVHVTCDERTGRVLAIGVIDNLVKGAAGQAVQAFNLAHGLPEAAGLEQHPLAP
jgi:N-acetyl-gamma-glutamyl-phosphate reductase